MLDFRMLGLPKIEVAIEFAGDIPSLDGKLREQLAKNEFLRPVSQRRIDALWAPIPAPKSRFLGFESATASVTISEDWDIAVHGADLDKCLELLIQFHRALTNVTGGSVTMRKLGSDTDPDTPTPLEKELRRLNRDRAAKNRIKAAAKVVAAAILGAALSAIVILAVG